MNSAWKSGGEGPERGPARGIDFGGEQQGIGSVGMWVWRHMRRLRLPNHGDKRPRDPMTPGLDLDQYPFVGRGSEVRKQVCRFGQLIRRHHDRGRVLCWSKSIKVRVAKYTSARPLTLASSNTFGPLADSRTAS